MDERHPHEVVVPFLALSNVWQRVRFTRVDVPGRGAMMLLEQLLVLCSAQRGALLLPKEHSIALAFASSSDYLTKPFSVEELLARVRAVLRRARLSEDEHAYALQRTMTLGDLTIDDARHLVTLAGWEITLSPTEYRLLFHLAQNAGRVVTQGRLLEHVWGDEYVGEGHLLQVAIGRLRSKLEPDPAHSRYLLTKPGIGYMLVAPADLQAGR